MILEAVGAFLGSPIHPLAAVGILSPLVFWALVEIRNAFSSSARR